MIYEMRDEMTKQNQKKTSYSLFFKRKEKDDNELG